MNPVALHRLLGFMLTLISRHAMTQVLPSQEDCAICSAGTAKRQQEVYNHTYKGQHAALTREYWHCLIRRSDYTCNALAQVNHQRIQAFQSAVEAMLIQNTP